MAKAEKEVQSTPSMIRLLREHAKLTPKDLSVMADIPIKRLYRLEAKLAKCTPKEFEELVAVLKPTSKEIEEARLEHVGNQKSILYKLRERRGHTLKDMAYDLHMSYTYLHAVENLQKPLTASLLYALKTYYNLTEEEDKELLSELHSIRLKNAEVNMTMLNDEIDNEVKANVVKAHVVSVDNEVHPAPVAEKPDTNTADKKQPQNIVHIVRAERNRRRFEIVEGWHDTATIPVRKTKLSAGYDICSAENITIGPRSTAAIPTGIRCHMADDEYLGVYLRSSIALRQNLIMANAVGIIDADYVNADNGGNIHILVHNVGPESVKVRVGDRIAQCIFHKYYVTQDDGDIEKEERVGGLGSTK